MSKSHFHPSTPPLILFYNMQVAFALLVHDIPSGVCIAVPTYCATGSKKIPFILCLIAAAAYPIGGLIGWAIVATASEAFIDAFIGALFGVTAGLLLYFAFVELLPTAIMTAKRHGGSMQDEAKYKKVYMISIGGIFVGFLVMDISGIILDATGGHSH